MYDEIYEDVQILKNLLVNFATSSGPVDNEEFSDLRKKLMSNSCIRDFLPGFLGYCRTLTEFWGFIKEKFPSYQERRNYLRDEFNPALTFLEDLMYKGSPLDNVVNKTINNNAGAYIKESWEKALNRRINDPEGAITMARTLLETTMKHILDESKRNYDEKADLPQLYKEVQSILGLAPNEYTEEIFKKILSGCVSVVTGLGALRNKLSDAHGKGKNGTKPSVRHAQLAVNLAGSMAEFLISSWEEKKQKELSR
ncbi:abortive infection family protein [Lysinibacillus sp. 38-6]|uniref:abortive infection family protein n=1 Tax=Lysinibacillus sp. 38-6 TaxID=3385991 RepID=UPI0039089B0D